MPTNETDNEETKKFNIIASFKGIKVKNADESKNFQLKRELAQTNELHDKENLKNNPKETIASVLNFVNMVEDNTRSLKKNIINSLNQTKGNAPSVRI